MITPSTAASNAAGEEGEYDPDRMKLHTIAQQPRVDQIALDNLPQQKDPKHEQDAIPAAELRQRQCQGGDEASD